MPEYTVLTVDTEGRPAEAWVVGFIVYQGGPEAKSPSRDDHEEPILKSVGKTWNCSIYSSRAVVGGQEELVIGGMGSPVWHRVTLRVAMVQVHLLDDR